jgi:nucleoside-diphosphate-sugar epimerase
MAKVFLTGGSGFIGWHVVKALVARGDQVTCLVRNHSLLARLQPLGVRLVYGDVTNLESLRSTIAGSEIVYHVAGRITALHAAEYYRVNADGARNVAQACAEQPSPPVLVWVSSLAAAGPAVDGRPRTEDDPLRQVSHYGRSKRAGEMAVEKFADRVPISIIRPPLVFGEADRTGFDMVQPISRFRLHLLPGLARYRVSLIHATDLANLLILAAQRGARLVPSQPGSPPSSQGYYFAAGPEDILYADLGRMIRTVLKRRVVLVLPVPTPVVYTVATGAELFSQICRKPLNLNIDRVRVFAAGSWLCSPQRAIDQLGFRVETPLIERWRQTIAWYREAGWL